MSSGGSDDHRWIIASPPRSSSVTTGSRCRLPYGPTRPRSIQTRNTGLACPRISPALRTPTTTISWRRVPYQRNSPKTTSSLASAVMTSGQQRREEQRLLPPMLWENALYVRDATLRCHPLLGVEAVL